MEPFPRQDGTGAATARSPIAAPLWRRAIVTTVTAWALAGGVLIAALAIMTAASAASNLLFARPFAADYELMKHVVAVAIFMFLPYCQLTGANVSVDIFTERMGERAKSGMAILSSLFALVFAAILLRQMSFGMQSYIRYPETTPVLRLPLWTAFPPMLLSLALLFAAALVTAIDGWRGARDAPGLASLPSPARGD